MYLYSYFRSAIEIINSYKGDIPFAAWLKEHFRQHKKYGSKDRKMISNLCFSYYRLGKSFAEKTIEERILLAQFLCHEQSLIVKEMKPEWNEFSSLSIKEKVQAIGNDVAVSIFPLEEEISAEIDKEAFILSHLVQPDLFLRIRPGNQNVVVNKLENALLPFSVEENCVRLPNMSKVDGVLDIDKEVVIQDKNSQKVLENLQPTANGQRTSFTSWDCCAASGGKTILLHDYFPEGQFTVSDVRESILHNLKSRFKRAGIKQYQSFVADVSSAEFLSSKKYDVIICDAPCSGSGTWGRTPEQLSFFTSKKLEYYAGLQKSIALNASSCLKKGGFFIYITCSVYKKENEEVVKFITEKTNLQLIRQQYYKGYTDKADTLFAALFLL